MATKGGISNGKMQNQKSGTLPILIANYSSLFILIWNLLLVVLLEELLSVAYPQNKDQ
ncbi:MAG: hypothetical protein CSYNP_02343 [Syntrophus sp. SKADARSKE-3]|nr:hypothetical protein [Syntrophus sp. SKADARSKE-3]